MPQPSLKLNFVWAFIGNGISAVCMWLLLVILAKIGSPEDVGLYAVGAAVGLPISMFFSLKLHLVQVTDANYDYTFGHYLAVKIITAIITVVFISTAGFVFYSGETALVITLLGLGYGLITFREVFLAVMQKSERMDKAAISRTIQSILSLILFAVIFFVTHNLPLSVCGLFGARLIGLLLYDIPVSHTLLARGSAQQEVFIQGVMPQWHWRKLCRLVIVSFPLGMVGWLGTLFTSIPRLVIDKHFGKEQLGYFAAISSLLVVGNLFISALSQTASPRLAAYFMNNIKAYLVLNIKLMLLFVLLGLAGVVISYTYGKYILALLFGSDYAEYSSLLNLVMWAAVLLFIFSGLNIAITSARLFKIQVPIFGLSAIGATLASLVLIPQYGIYGGAWALIICYAIGIIVFMVAFCIVYQRQIKNQKIIHSKNNA